MKTGHFLVALVSIPVFASLAAFAGAPDAKGSPSDAEIVAKVRAFYAGASDYQAAFVQTIAHKMFQGRLERAYGRVLFKRGGLMRWEYHRPDKKLFIYDGKTLWIYEPEVPQVFAGTGDTERYRRALAFLTGESDLTQEYRVARLPSDAFGFAQGFVLGLTPKDRKSPFDHVELYVSSADFHVVRSVLVDREGNRNRLDFENPLVGKGLDPALFTFTPPKGVPVITNPQ
ncbi:MAG: outer membrane lipoprotein chaperone LolA [Deltaproteobacteria bacterium]|nr:outer membrane lipoprotein chaperone LolA [Deltaproteobacteria bacterium]